MNVDTHNRVVIGWKERVDLPNWGIVRIRAKIDTGARSSSIHVDSYALLPNNRVEFWIVKNNLYPDKKKKIVCDIQRITQVRSSNGLSSQRIFVSTMVRIGPVLQTVELGLVNRSMMKYPMLIGRTALRETFIVDVTRGYTF